MAVTSFGWAGTVNESQYALLGVITQAIDYAKGSLTDWTVTAVSNQRAVSVSPGTGGGKGVVTTTDAAETITATTPQNGGWFLLVRNRVWSSKVSQLLLRAHTLTAINDSGPIPTTYPATYKNQPGVEDDVPIAWVWVNSANTQVGIVPILRPSHVFPRRGSTADRDAFYGAPPTDPAAQSGLHGAEWYNAPGEWRERYYKARPGSPTGSVVDPGRPAGWHPVEGHMPSVNFAHDNGYNQSINSGAETALLGYNTPARSYWGNGSQGEPQLGIGYLGSGAFNIGQPGRWRYSAYGNWANSTAGSYRALGARTAGQGLVGYDRRPVGSAYINIAGDFIVTAPDTFTVVAAHDTGGQLAFHLQTATLTYVGPN